MKTTICAEELRELNACEEGYVTFYEAHGESAVKLSEALESNGMGNVFWLLGKLKLSEQQQNDLHLLACTYAEDVLPVYEEAYPTDNRPRKAIETKRLWVAGKASEEELREARAAAWAAASGAASEVASEAATLEAAWAAEASARAAAKAATRDKQKGQLRQVLISWERA